MPKPPDSEQLGTKDRFAHYVFFGVSCSAFFMGFDAVAHWLLGSGHTWIDGLWQGWVLATTWLVFDVTRTARRRRRQNRSTPASGK